jgi:hypothetical protein
MPAIGPVRSIEIRLQGHVRQSQPGTSSSLVLREHSACWCRCPRCGGESLSLAGPASVGMAVCASVKRAWESAQVRMTLRSWA